MTTADPTADRAAADQKHAGWSRGLSLSGSALKRRIRERFTEPAALRGAYRRAQATPLYTLPQDQTGSADRGRRLLDGVFKFSEVAVEATPETIWSLHNDTPGWTAELQSFGWLGDLAALGRPAAKKLATTLTVGWLNHAVRYDPLVWSSVVSANRLRSWLVCSDILPLDAENGAKLTRSAMAHLDWLLRRFDAPAGLPAITVGVAILEATVSLEGASTRYEIAASRLDQILGASLLQDGGVVGRAPSDGLIALDRLGLLLARCEEAGAPVSAALRDAPGRLGRALRFFRGGDGGLPVFHGGWEAADGRLDVALTRYKLPAEPARELPQSGYMKLVGGRVTVMMDAAPTPPGPASERGHASALSIEMLSGRRRLVVNCGSGAHLSAQWRQFGRGAASHSTSMVENSAFAKPALARVSPTGEEEIALVGPPKVTQERKEERNGVWALASHDGYVADYGLTTTRRLFLSAEGGDFRGEDSFRAEGALAKKTFEKRLSKLPRARREQGVPATARFHLHPEVSAALVAEGEAATLRLPHGEVWVMRQSGGALQLEDSVYLGRWGRPETTRAIVIRAGVGEEGGRIRWAFRRVGELEQLPKDLDALLPPPGAPEDALFGPRGDLHTAKRPTSPPNHSEGA